MANNEHLNIIKQGVQAWNKWREENPQIVLNLKGQNLCDADLTGANLSGADLSSAVLNRVDLTDADLTDANLRGACLSDVNLDSADLIDADLMMANLSGAQFHNADLAGAHLDRADLSDASLSEANLRFASLSSARLIRAHLNRAHLRDADLTDANLRFAMLDFADLTGADLSKAHLNSATLFSANLSRASLRGADLTGADLREASLSGADLTSADLSKADLSRADLSNANLQMASMRATRLIYAKLDEANLTEACLWETQRTDWSIKGILCDSVYWDLEAKEKETYQRGDFERLFTHKIKIKLFYKDGISPIEIATLPALIKHLEAAHPGCGLRLVSIREDSGGAVVELGIEDFEKHSPDQLKQLRSVLEAEAKQRIEYQRQALVERETRLQLEGEIKQLNTVVDKLILRPSIYVNTQGGFMGDKYEISGQAGAVGPNAHAHDMTFNQLVNQVEKSIDLTVLAKQLSELRQAVTEKQDASPQAAIALGRVAEAEVAATEKNTPKVVEHLKAAGQWTLDFAKGIGKDVVVAAIKQSMGMP